MFNRQLGIYMHGWIAGMEVHPEFHWARANGWALMAMTELLEVLPEDHPGRAAVLEQFRAHVRGLAALQGPNGLWHQLLDRNDSYLETSATAIYTYCLAHAINRGWIDALAYGPAVQLAWNAVATKVTADGQGRKELVSAPAWDLIRHFIISARKRPRRAWLRPGAARRCGNDQARQERQGRDQ